jgi:HSP20 family protein
MTALTRWNPFTDIERLLPRDMFARDFFGRFLPDGGVAVEWSPRCDIDETDQEIVVHVELPGVEAKDMEVSVSDSMLTLRGEKRTEKKEDKGGRKYSERFFGSFERSLSIPSSVDESKVEARLRDGVLEVHMPKTAPVTPASKKIEITPG